MSFFRMYVLPEDYLYIGLDFLAATLVYLLVACSRRMNHFAGEIWRAHSPETEVMPPKKKKKNISAFEKVQHWFRPDLERGRFLRMPTVFILMLCLNLSFVIGYNFNSFYQNTVGYSEGTLNSTLNFFLRLFVFAVPVGLIVLFSRKFLMFIDFIAVSLAAFCFATKIRCSQAGCCSGIPWEGFLSHYNPVIGANLLFVQAIDMAWMAFCVITAIMFMLKGRRYRPGLAAPLLAVMFAVFRSLSEIIRSSDDRIRAFHVDLLGISTAYWGCLLFVLLAAIYLLLFRRISEWQDKILRTFEGVTLSLSEKARKRFAKPKPGHKPNNKKKRRNRK